MFMACGVQEDDRQLKQTAAWGVKIGGEREREKELHLAISDVWVPEGVGSEDPAQRGDAHLVLKGRVFGEGAVQVSFYLLSGQVVLAHGLLHQVLVVARVGGHLVDRPCAQRFTLTSRSCFACRGNTPHTHHWLLGTICMVGIKSSIKGGPFTCVSNDWKRGSSAANSSMSWFRKNSPTQYEACVVGLNLVFTFKPNETFEEAEYCDST